jgi:hypothetical protein
MGRMTTGAADKQQTPEIRDKDITGLKYLDKLLPLLNRLHEVGCQRDRAGNRRLHFDQYCLLILLYVFSPLVDSLRALQQASELKRVQRRLGSGRFALGSFSEAAGLFDAQLLLPVIAELWGRNGEETKKRGRVSFLMRWSLPFVRFS